RFRWPWPLSLPPSGRPVSSTNVEAGDASARCGNPSLPGDPSNTPLATPIPTALRCQVTPGESERRGPRLLPDRSVGVATFLGLGRPRMATPDSLAVPPTKSLSFPLDWHRLAHGPEGPLKGGRKARRDAIRRGH